ncbi:hypothetical protein D3C84_989320 [compost metagenome]
MHLQGVTDVLGDAHVWKKRVVLEYKTDIARLYRKVGDVVVTNKNSAGGGCR